MPTNNDKPFNIDTMRKGFIQDSSGNNLLPITHVNLIIGDDGTSIPNTFKRLREEHAALKAEHETIMQEHAILKDEQIELGNKIDLVDNKLTSVDTFALLDSIPTESLIKGAIAYVVNDDKYYSYTSEGWKPMTTGSNGGVYDDTYSHIWVGPTPPEDTRMIWIDTTDDGIPDNETDYETLISLLNQVAEMQIEIINLKDRIEYLEKNGVVVNPDDPDDPDEPIVDGDDIVLLEDGFELLLEDGTPLLLEIQTEEPTNDGTLLFENGEEVLLEDGNNLLLER